MEYERQEREDIWNQIIDNFEKEIVEREREFKVLRTKEEGIFDETSLTVFQLE